MYSPVKLLWLNQLAIKWHFYSKTGRKVFHHVLVRFKQPSRHQSHSLPTWKSSVWSQWAIPGRAPKKKSCYSAMEHKALSAQLQTCGECSPIILAGILSLAASRQGSESQRIWITTAAMTSDEHLFQQEVLPTIFPHCKIPLTPKQDIPCHIMLMWWHVSSKHNLSTAALWQRWPRCPNSATHCI